MKSKFVLSLLAVIGTLALSATAAHAGAGGTPFALTSFFLCHGINGKDQGVSVDVEGDDFGPNRQGVRVGSASLACAVAKVFNAGTAEEVQPVPADPQVTRQELKCYSIAVSRKPEGPGGPGRYNSTDAFGTEPVQISQLHYLCAPATSAPPF
jgi:hypothetical protein